jgi:hypothetical protein
VIEHFRSPRQALEKIYPLIAPGGRLYLECPSLAVHHARRSELFHFAHIHTFTPATLLHLAQQCGFTLHACYSNGLGLNLKLLFVKTRPQFLLPLPSYQTTLQLLRDYHAPWHRWQGWYLYGRLRRYVGYAREYLLARSVARSILAHCRQTSPRQAA